MRKCLLLLCAMLLTAGCAGGFGAKSGTAAQGKKGKAIRVGVILPLSGDYGIYGRSTLNGIECAAGLKPPCDGRVPVVLVVKDSAGDPTRAAAAVSELAEENVVAIVGPLMSRTVAAAAEVAEKVGIPLVSLSQRSGVADVGSHIYSVGMNAQSQVNTIARYAVREKGLKRFAVVYPKNSYGSVFRDLFKTAVSSLGGEVVEERHYDAQFAKIITARKKAKQAAMMAPMKRQYRLNKTGEVIEVVGSNTPLPKMKKLTGKVDAVFIPDTYRAVLGMMDTYGPDIFGNAVLLGVSRWNSSGFLAGGSTVQGAVFVDGFFKGSSNIETQRFVSTFLQAFNVEPTILEAQAYDAMQVVSVAASRGGRTAGRLQWSLQKMGKYHGVTGRMRFMPSGAVDKDLFVLTVRHGAINEVGMRRSSKRVSVAEETILPVQLKKETQQVERDGWEKYDIGGSAEFPENEDLGWDKYEPLF